MKQMSMVTAQSINGKRNKRQFVGGRFREALSLIRLAMAVWLQQSFAVC